MTEKEIKITVEVDMGSEDGEKKKKPGNAGSKSKKRGAKKAKVKGESVQSSAGSEVASVLTDCEADTVTRAKEAAVECAKDPLAEMKAADCPEACSDGAKSVVTKATACTNEPAAETAKCATATREYATAAESCASGVADQGGECADAYALASASLVGYIASFFTGSSPDSVLESEHGGGGSTRCTTSALPSCSGVVAELPGAAADVSEGNCLPNTVLKSAPEELAAGVKGAAEQVEDSLTESGASEDESEAGGSITKKATVHRRGTGTGRRTTRGTGFRASLSLLADNIKSQVKPPDLPPIKQHPYAFATYVTIIMIYVFGLALLPYAVTHSPDKLYWPLFTLFITAITSVLLRTQLMIRVVPEKTEHVPE